MLSARLSPLAAGRVILASQSPRRLQLLRECGVSFEVIPSTFEENLPKNQFPSPESYVIENAKLKALEVVQRIAKQTHDDKKPHVVIGCDTVVVYNGKILEKPKDEDDAVAMLSSLSGHTHEVYSGVAIFTSKLGESAPHVFYEATSVVFAPLDLEDIRAYVKTGEPMDKAGSYGLQGLARCWVREVHGCLNNVIGFPVQRVAEEIQLLAAKKQL